MTISKRDIYIEDDWNDNKLKDRDNVEEGYFLYPSDNVVDNDGDVEAGTVLKAIYRPYWDKDNESNGTIETTEEVLQLDGGGGSGSGVAVKTPCVLSVGQWRFEWTLSTDNPSENGMYWSIANSTSYRNNKNLNNGYFIWWDEDGSQYNINSDEEGSTSNIIGSSWTVNTNTHVTKVTRNSYGHLELFLDGTSQGTSTDTKWSNFQYMALTNEMERVDYDNLEVK